MTPRKRKLADCASGILSTDDCPVCHTSEHRLVDCQRQEAQTLVWVLKQMKEEEKKAAPKDSKNGGGEDAKAAKRGKGAKETGPKPKRWER